MSLTLLLYNTDPEKTREFYENLPGFDVTESARQTLTIQGYGSKLLFTCQDLWQAPPTLTGTIYFTVQDVARIYHAIADHAHIAWPLQTMNYGSTEFAITDCNGYLLAFRQQVT